MRCKFINYRYIQLFYWVFRRKISISFDTMFFGSLNYVKQLKFDIKTVVSDFVLNVGGGKIIFVDVL